MEQIDVNSYERIIIACSGGKDSVAALLHLLDCGAPMERMELWHHDVDGGTVHTAILAQPDLVARALEHQWHGPVVDFTMEDSRRSICGECKVRVGLTC